MRLLENLLREKAGLPPMCAFEEDALGHQDDVAVGYIILGITVFFGIYLLVQIIDQIP